MPISNELLNILCCPVTKKPVRMLAVDQITKLNAAIASGKVKDVDGNIVKDKVAEALITDDNKTIYRIDEGIPVMLAGMGIPADSLQ
jgi:uncharacterized protein YbaR (Trm112 family)